MILELRRKRYSTYRSYPGVRITFYYTIIPLDFFASDKKWLKANLRPHMVKYVCNSNKGMRMNFKYEGAYGFDCSNCEGSKIVNFIIDGNNCVV